MLAYGDLNSCYSGKDLKLAWHIFFAGKAANFRGSENDLSGEAAYWISDGNNPVPSELHPEFPVNTQVVLKNTSSQARALLRCQKNHTFLSKISDKG